jgi:hypothetical protein
MKRIPLVATLSLLALTGCQTQNQANGAVGGGVIGGALGLGIGALLHRPAEGMLIGAGTGALAGTAVGANKDAQQAKAAQAYADAHAISLTQVVEMTNRGIPENQIVSAIVQSNSYYNLSPADLTYLNNEHVSPNVIATMQRSPQVVVPGRAVYVAQPVYAPPPPPPIGVGVGVTIPLR